MDNQNQNQYRSPNGQNGQNDTAAESKNAVAGRKTGGSACPCTGADEMLTLMDRSDKTCVLGQWMKCLRKPALSVQYTLDKRHIPDMDSETAGKDGSPDQSKAAAPIKGANADVMTVKGGFTIRYFDLAAGMVTLLAACCIIKGCCCLKKMM